MLGAGREIWMNKLGLLTLDDVELWQVLVQERSLSWDVLRRALDWCERDPDYAPLQPLLTVLLEAGRSLDATDRTAFNIGTIVGGRSQSVVAEEASLTGTLRTVDPDVRARLRAAMATHPEMVSGDGRSDLALMQAGRGDWVAKIGAEGVQAIGVASRGWGIAIKVADGAARGLLPATVAVLDQLGLLDAAQRAALAAWREPPVRNTRGVVTGAVRPVVVLDNDVPPASANGGRAAGPGPA